MRRLSAAALIVLCLALGALAGFAGTASAGPPVGGCPSENFELVTLQELADLLGITLEQVQGIPAVDTNGDFNTCVAQSASGRFHGTDNVVPIR